MNTRLINYLRSLGLANDANEADSWEFMQGLRGIQSNIANALNYNQNDVQARTNCDLLIRALGYNPDSPGELLPSEDDGNQHAEDANPVDADALRNEGVLAERSRVAEIRETAELAGSPDELVNRLVADTAITASTARSQIMEDHRQRTRATVAGDTPAVHTRNGSENSREVLTALMLGRSSNDPARQWPVGENGGQVRLVDRSSDDVIARAVDTAHGLRGLSIVEICARAMALDGIRNVQPTLQSVENGLSQYSRSMMGTSALVGIFTDSMNAQLISAYESAPDTTEGWTVVRDVTDYKTNERTRLEKSAGPMGKRARGGTAEMAAYSDAVEQYKVFEYAEQFVIDRQDLINDSFGAMQEFTPMELGQKAKEVHQDIVYAIMLSNPDMRDANPLFDAVHANLNSTNPLNVENLEKARAALRIQMENGRNLNLRATHLIVPAALESTAVTLVESDIVVMGSDRVRGNLNTNSRAGIVPVADARLDNGVIDPSTGTQYSGSASDWFLASTQGPTIEIGYIRSLGRNPQVRGFILDRGQFGIGFDVSQSVGAKALDWRAMSKSTA